MDHGGPAARAEEDDTHDEALTAPRGGASLRGALLVTAASALLPGLAHIRAGRARTGGAMIVAFGLAVTAAAVAVGRHEEALPSTAAQPNWLTVCAVAAGAVAVIWTTLLIRSYTLVRPASMSRSRRVAGAAATGIICLAALTPPLTAARYAYLQRDLLSSVFPGDAAPGAVATPVVPPGTARAHRPWTGPRRLNVLLLGGDADYGRPGVRTDSMNVASVNTETGDTTLLSLPRNLQHVPVWTGDRVLPFPSVELLNAVYRYGTEHPRAVGRRMVRNPGAELLKRTVGHIVDLPVHYYAMVDMRSFEQIIDAMDGVRVCVDHTVQVPSHTVSGGHIRPGCRTLSGQEAVWYGRSRTGSSDFSRMSHQKNLLRAIARQAGPLTVLRSFQRLTRVFKYSVNTDIPRELLPGLIALAGRVKHARISSIQFVPPLVSTGRPDYKLVRRLAHAAICEPANGAVNTEHIGSSATPSTACQ
jgi:LCP family protein required for cell wall assembly